MIKNALDFSKKCNLKVCVLLFDEENNVMQEMKSSPEFSSEFVVKHKHENGHLKLSERDQQRTNRKGLPQKSFIEEKTM